MVVGGSGGVTLAENRLAIGNKSRWPEARSPGAAGVDTEWRPSPVSIRKEIIGAIRGDYFYTPNVQSVEDGGTDADSYGCRINLEDGEAGRESP